jgi:HK97 family phage major capsid protein
MDANIQVMLDALTKANEKFHQEMGNDVSKQLLEFKNGELMPINDQIKTVGDAYKAMDSQVKALQEEIARQKREIVPGLADDVKKDPILLTEAIPGLPSYKKDSSSATRLREYNDKHPNSQTRDMTSTDSASGGLLVGLELLPGFLDLARESRKIWDPTFITEMDGLNGNIVEMPKLTGGTAVYWVTENQAPTKSGVTFGQVRMSPHKAAAHTRLSNRLLRQVGPLPEQILQRDIARAIGNEMDRILIHGLGNQNEPLGLANRPGIQSLAIGSNGGDWTFDVAQDMVEMLELAFKDDGVITFGGHTRCINRAKKQRIAQFSNDTGGMYVGGYPLMSDAMFRNILGYDIRKSQQFLSTIAKGTGTNLGEVVAGKWKDLWLGVWSTLTFKASTETGDNTGSAVLMDQTWLFAYVEVDVGCAYEQSFVLCNDAKTRA